ncbi:MAG: DUF3015 domain-containing protein [Gammaproteobacteria bacterium]|nr:DUF3015 domain-containing protein [Gammaproteobacteria bacterium]
MPLNSMARSKTFNCPDIKMLKKMILAVFTGVYIAGTPGICQGFSAVLGLSTYMTEGSTQETSDALVRTKGDADISRFVAINQDKLARDIAVGQGETLESLAHILKIKKHEKKHFFWTVHRHFKTIFPPADVSSQYPEETWQGFHDNQAEQDDSAKLAKSLPRFIEKIPTDTYTKEILISLKKVIESDQILTKYADDFPL